MRPRRLPPLGAALLALAAGAAGCEGCRERSPDGARRESGDVAGEPSRASPRRVGVKVPVPTGWSTQPAEDGSLRVGPVHHPVFRVDLRPGEGEDLPRAEALAALLARAFAGFARSDEQWEEGADTVLVRMMLGPRLADGGMGEPHPAFFGARRVERDLFLCASLPGVSADEVREAAEACQGIQVPAPPR